MRARKKLPDTSGTRRLGTQARRIFWAGATTLVAYTAALLALYGRLCRTEGQQNRKGIFTTRRAIRCRYVCGVNPIRDQYGSVVAIAGSFDEELWGSEPEVRDNNLAAHGCLDVITGIPNHAFTQSHLRENLAFFEEYHLPFGILCIEVGGMGELRATHGRKAVDVMLHVVAQTMKHTLRPDGFIGRWTDSQFLAIVTNCGSADLERAAQSVQKMASCSGIQWWDDRLSVSVAVGRAMVQSEDTMESFLERASSALEKNPGKRTAAAASGGGQASAES